MFRFRMVDAEKPVAYSGVSIKWKRWHVGKTHIFWKQQQNFKNWLVLNPFWESLQSEEGGCNEIEMINQSSLPTLVITLKAQNVEEEHMESSPAAANCGDGEGGHRHQVWWPVFKDEIFTGRIPLPNRMNFWKHSKWRLTPPPHFWKGQK